MMFIKNDKKNIRMNVDDRQSRNDLDQAFTELAAILKSIGVEELTVNEHDQHHTVNTDAITDTGLVQEFCNQIHQLFQGTLKSNWTRINE
ncbi:MAG: hypothetical protein H7257_05310 [Taibaiella sp.]|nr:hypothetical protein [Taibaiella sp.]